MNIFFEKIRDAGLVITETYSNVNDDSLDSSVYTFTVLPGIEE
ncbi:MAG: hypothetical protein R6U96_12065 [Promethearchaeia archaeon]